MQGWKGKSHAAFLAAGCLQLPKQRLCRACVVSETSSAGSLRLSEARACPPGTGQASGLGCVLILGHPAGSAHPVAARSGGEKAAGLSCPAPAGCSEGGVGGVALWSLQISEKLFPALPSPRWMQHRWIRVLADIPLGARDTFHVHLRSGAWRARPRRS